MDRNMFCTRLKFEPNDILNPRVCKGEMFYYNILKSLGVNQKLLDNPVVIRRLEHWCENVLEVAGFRYDPNNPTRESIAHAVSSLSRNVRRRRNGCKLE